jgi:hypothetical protein
MKIRRSLALLVLVSSLSSSAARAQATQDNSSGGADSARTELEGKAVGLLEDALEEAQGLKLPENRVHAETVAAGLLWTRDEQAARAAFKSAADAVAALLGALDPEDPDFYNAAQAVASIRTQLLQTVAPHDPKLALDFLRATRMPHPEAFGEQFRWQITQDQMLEANLAAQLAAQDPRQALAVAEEALNRGLSQGFAGVLQQLNAKDPATASKLAGEIVQKLSAEKIVADGEASGLAYQLLSMTKPADPSAQASQQAVVAFSDGPLIISGSNCGRCLPGNNLSIDPQARADLLEKFVTAAMSAQPNRGGSYMIYQGLQALMPELEKAMPARVAALRRRMSELERSFNPQGDVWKPYREVMEKGTVEAMLEAAAKAPPEVRDNLYSNAAWKAFNDGGDPERARQIAENLSNPQQRAQLRKSIDQQVQSRVAGDGRFAEALQMVSRLPTVEEKVQALVQIAAAAASKNDRATALQVLAQARGLIEGQPRGQAQFAAWLQIADAYAPLDAETAFSMVEAAIGQLNELLDAAAVVNGFGQYPFSDGELKLQGGYPWGDLITQCGGALALLAPSDFDRARSDAKSFRRADARASAQLTLAESLLNTITARRPSQRFNRRVQSMSVEGNVVIDKN